MISPKEFAAALALALFAALGAGCQTHKTVTPLSHGYEEVSYPIFAVMAEPPPPRVALQYRSADGTVTPVWPALYGVNEVIRGNLVIFVGEMGFITPERETHARLFAVRSPDLPLDISDQVLARWCRASGKDFGRARERFTSATPTEADGGLQLDLEFWAETTIGAARDDWPEHAAIQVSWAQIEQMMRAVKANGAEHKDLRWNTPYIGEKF